MKNRTVVVTGASSGIGRETAIVLNKKGARIVCIGRNEERLRQTVSLLEGDGNCYISYDLNNGDGLAQLFIDTARKVGRLYGLVHAAGVNLTLPVRSLMSRNVKPILSVNAEAALYLTQAFIKRDVCDEFGGSIVFISSVHSLTGSPGVSAYSMSKGALNSLARSLAIELSPRKIRVNCVVPGYVETSMLKLDPVWLEQKENIEKMHPLGLGSERDVANAIAFLMDSESRWITGSMLVVDGGYTVK